VDRVKLIVGGGEREVGIQACRDRRRGEKILSLRGPLRNRERLGYPEGGERGGKKRR